MKKQILLSSLFLLGLFSCNNPTNFKGSVDGVSSDTLLIYISDPETGQWLQSDTIPLVNSRFETTIKASRMVEVAMAAKSPYGKNDPEIFADMFYFFPGDKMTVQGILPGEVVASGTELYDELGQLDTLMKVEQEYGAINKRIKSLDDISNVELLDSLFCISDSLEVKRNMVRLDCVRKNSGKLVAAYLSLDMFPKEGLEALSLLSPKIREGSFSRLLDLVQKEYQRDLDLQQRKVLIKVGNMAPDFRLKDMSDIYVSLEQFRGKYVVLDFWGTWCGWCLSGIPKMKEYYTKYRQKVEFVGLCCRDTEENWRNCVFKRDMVWPNLIDDKSTDIALKYGVTDYPTKIILNEKGEIIEIFEGETLEFYDRLDELFSDKS